MKLIMTRKEYYQILAKKNWKVYDYQRSPLLTILSIT